MCALIAMAIFSTEENQKDDCLARTLQSLLHTVDFTRHNIGLSINAATERTEELINEFQSHLSWDDTECIVIRNEKNIGTAEAINKVWQANPGDHLHKLKMDDDIVVHEQNWLDELVRAVETDKKIGIVGLKRKDCQETPFWPSAHPYHSELYIIGGGEGRPWIIGERVYHVMGSCQLYSRSLLEKIGYLYQLEGNLYGFDDALAAARCQVAGMKSVFLPHIEIDHIDPGNTPYQAWKAKVSGERMDEYNRVKAAYLNGSRSIYYNPFK